MNTKSDISLLRSIKVPEITSSMLIGLLSSYGDPRKKIHTLVKSGFFKSVKQGVYVVSEEFGLRSYSLEILANLIYGPSYVSLESALSYYGIIPERVSATTSVCIGKGRKFSTPVGEFEYHHIKESIYSEGVQLREVFENSYCQFASLEKAILDFIYLREKKGDFKNSKEYLSYVVESYRFDTATLIKAISKKKLKALSKCYLSEHISWFTSELLKLN